MNFKKNVFVSFLSQIYVSFIGVLILPIYMHYMGAEAFGLVGFFSMLQVCFNLLDFGLTPTISRETARLQQNPGAALQYRQLFRALSCLFLIIAVLGGGLLFFLSDAIALHWLKSQQLPRAEITFALQNMAVCVALRWICGLYRGVIQGSEKLIWIGFFNILINTFRFVFVLPVMWYWGASPAVFFSYQVVIALLELSILLFKARRLLPAPLSAKIGWSFTAIKSIVQFSLILAFTSAVWTIVTQLDKLVLSKLLPLDEYGYFTSAVLVASSVILVLVPVANSLMPRMAKLEAEDKPDELLLIYRQATQLVAVVAGSIAITLIFCAKPLLCAWLGNQEMADHIAPILKLYTLGNVVFVLAAFPYYLQYAKGNLRLHFYGHVLLLVVLIPFIIGGAIYFGALGAGYAWIIVNSLYFLIWVTVIHERLVPGLHKVWIQDIVRIVLVFCIPCVTYLFFDFQAASRLGNLVITACFGALVLILSSMTTLFFQKKNLQNAYQIEGNSE